MKREEDDYGRSLNRDGSIFKANKEKYGLVINSDVKRAKAAHLEVSEEYADEVI